MQRKESAIEVKVGGLVLLAIAVFAGFILVLGDCNFNPGYQIFVRFENAAGLKPGAPVRLSGIPAGNVRSVKFEGGERPVMVTLFIEDSIRENIRSDAHFTITTQGVLGEPYVEISSFDQSQPVIEAGAILEGTDPPRLDMLLASAYQGIEGIRELIQRMNDNEREDAIRLDDLVNNIADLAHNIDERVVENQEEIDSMIANLDSTIREVAENRDTIPGILRNTESATGEFDRLGRSLNAGVGNGGEIRSILRNVDAVTETLDAEAEPTLTSIRGAAESAERILTENEEEISTTVSNAEQITGDLVEASSDVREMVARIEAGEGSIGRLLQDEEIFEDLREFVRELKRRPWRIIWKE